MAQSCSKFRLFNILLLFCFVNCFVFRSFLRDKLRSVRVLSPYSNSLFPAASQQTAFNMTGVLNGSLAGGGGDGSGNVSAAVGAVGSRLATARSDVKRVGLDHQRNINSTTGGGSNGVNVTGVRSLNGSAFLHSEGKTIYPQAKASVPWKPDRNTELCPLVPPKLVGKLATFKVAPNWTEIVARNPGLEVGGHYHPANCRARHRVAIIVPYRNRAQHLRVMLHNLLPILMRQQLDFFVLVVELAEPTVFNRGMLMNIGAVEALGMWDVQCFIFHDVDLVPENDRNLYTCPEMPRHMSVAVDKFGYKLPYNWILGGVTALKREHLSKINGYSNMYFGWGGEDDDLSSRVRNSGLKVTRYSVDIARYRMIKHERDKKNEPNPQRHELLRKFQNRWHTDGLNSLKYQVQKVEFRPAYTWILVSINRKDIVKS